MIHTWTSTSCNQWQEVNAMILLCICTVNVLSMNTKSSFFVFSCLLPSQFSILACKDSERSEVQLLQYKLRCLGEHYCRTPCRQQFRCTSSTCQTTCVCLGCSYFFLPTHFIFRRSID